MRPNQMGPNQMGPNHMGPNHMGPNHMVPAQMHPNQMGPNFPLRENLPPRFSMRAPRDDLFKVEPVMPIPPGPRGRTGLTEPLLICDLPGQNITANATLMGEPAQVADSLAMAGRDTTSQLSSRPR